MIIRYLDPWGRYLKAEVSSIYSENQKVGTQV